MKFGGSHALFATPLLYWQHDDAIFHEQLVNEILAMEATPRPTKPGQWAETVADIARVLDIFDRDMPGCHALGNMVRAAVAEKFSDRGWRLTSWANLNHPGSYHAIHHHVSEAKLSGVYYVQVPDDSGAIEFVSSVRSDGWFKERFVVKPAVGQLLMFPPSLLHWVPMNKSDKMRISIGFNAV